MSKTAPTEVCHLRLFHAYPTLSPLSVYFNDKLLEDDLLYEDFTKYQAIPCEDYQIKCTFSKKETLLGSIPLKFAPNRIYTLVLAPHPKAVDKLSFYCVEDVQRYVNHPDCVARLGHFAHTIGAIDFFQEDALLRFKNIEPTQISRYIPFESTAHHFQWIDHSYKKEILQLEHLFKPIRLYTLYLIGNGTKEFPIKCVVSIDGNSYLPNILLEKKEKRA